MGWSCLRFFGLPAFPFSLLTVLRFCLVLSPTPLGSATFASAHGLLGVQYTGSSFTSWMLALFLSACSLVLLPSACCSFSYLFCTSFSTFGFSFCRSFRSSLVASAVVSSDPQALVPPSLPSSVCPASLLLCLFAVCALLQTSGYS